VKKIVLTVLFALLLVEVAFLYSAKPVAAEETTSSGIKRIQSVLKEKLENRKEKVEVRQTNIKEKIEDRKGKIEEKKEDRVERVRKAAIVRYDVHKKAIERAEKLLEKLQVRIDKAKEAGQDVAEAERLMADAKNKLADTKIKLASIESKKGVAIDKAGFQEIQRLLQGIRQDLHVIRQRDLTLLPQKVKIPFVKLFVPIGSIYGVVKYEIGNYEDRIN